MSDTMFFGVLEMPYAMAMESELSRTQFYDRVQDAVTRVKAAEQEVESLQCRLEIADMRIKALVDANKALVTAKAQAERRLFDTTETQIAIAAAQPVATVHTFPTGTLFAVDHPDGVHFHPSMEQAIRYANDGKFIAYYSEAELRTHTAQSVAVEREHTDSLRARCLELEDSLLKAHDAAAPQQHAQCTWPKCQSTGGCNGPCRSAPLAHAQPIPEPLLARGAFVSDLLYDLYLVEREAPLQQHAQAAERTLICPNCKTDRLKGPCPKTVHECPMLGHAQAALSDEQIRVLIQCGGIRYSTLHSCDEQAAIWLVREALALSASQQPAAAPSAPAAWMTEDGERVVSAKTMAGAKKDGGAMLSSMKPFSVALVRAALAVPAAQVAVPEGMTAMLLLNAALCIEDEHGVPQAKKDSIVEKLNRCADQMHSALATAPSPTLPTAGSDTAQVAVPVEDCRRYCQREADQASGDIVKQAVDRFLGWKLPMTFSPDNGIDFHRPDHLQFWPIGTNLLTADQAKAMFEHCLSAAPLQQHAQAATELPIVLELPKGDTRTAKVWWHEVKDGKRHICISIENGTPAAGGDALSAIEPDNVLLDFLDTNLKMTMGWRVGIAPAGNVSIQSIIASKITIREAIHEAIATKHAAALGALNKQEPTA